MKKVKSVAVLLATYNGLRWLPEQVDSILLQDGVEVRLIVSDDQSADGTWEWLQGLADRDSRVMLLPHAGKFGGAGRNFFRLLRDACLGDADFVAYSDQDDIWQTNKLINHVALAIEHGCDGVSSNVLAFWPDGKQVGIIKSKPQRKLDYLFESGGPGCTFLMTRELVAILIELLNIPSLEVEEITLHDWFTYAVCRASGRQWFIDSAYSVLYRQHAGNELGANRGVKAALSRIKKISNGWYRGDILKILRVCKVLNHNPDYSKIEQLLTMHNAGFRRFSLLRYIGAARRDFTARVTLALFIALGIL